MLENFINLFGTFEVQALIRIILAAILAGIIGYERQSWKKPAGLRTHILVCESAVIVMLCGLYIQEKVGGSDPSRIPAQLLSGMGFIGAGTILRDGFHVKGLTTAASLLAVTGIGLLVGCGAYVTAVIATVIVYIILSYIYFVNSKLNKILNVNMEIIVEGDPKKIIERFQKMAIIEELIVKSMKIEENKLIVTGKAT
jgi:putative Mg2+ transporter-C (MgtC) family protein